MEALAAWRATEFALEIGIEQVIIEGDSEVIYKDLIDPGPSLALHGHLICDICSLLVFFLSVLLILWVKQEIMLPTIWQEGLFRHMI